MVALLYHIKRLFLEVCTLHSSTLLKAIQFPPMGGEQYIDRDVIGKRRPHNNPLQLSKFNKGLLISLHRNALNHHVIRVIRFNHALNFIAHKLQTNPILVRLIGRNAPVFHEIRPFKISKTRDERPLVKCQHFHSTPPIILVHQKGARLGPLKIIQLLLEEQVEHVVVVICKQIERDAQRSGIAIIGKINRETGLRNSLIRNHSVRNDLIVFSLLVGLAIDSKRLREGPRVDIQAVDTFKLSEVIDDILIAGCACGFQSIDSMGNTVIKRGHFERADGQTLYRSSVYCYFGLLDYIRFAIWRRGRNIHNERLKQYQEKEQLLRSVQQDIDTVIERVQRDREDAIEVLRRAAENPNPESPVEDFMKIWRGIKIH